LFATSISSEDEIDSVCLSSKCTPLDGLPSWRNPPRLQATLQNNTADVIMHKFCWAQVCWWK
jgi:hypothetical protein